MAENTPPTDDQPQDPPTAPPPPDAPQQPPAAPPPGDAPPPPADAPATPGDDPSQENPIMAALCYIIGVIMAIVVLVTDMKKSRYMRFHAFQSLFLCAVYVVISILYSIISAIPVVNIAALTGCLVGPAMLVLNIILAVKAYNKQDMQLPYITKLAAEQADKVKV